MPFNALARLAGTPASDHIYYNITISDDKTGTVSSSTGAVVEQPTQGSDLPLVFNQIRATPYLLRPEEYYLTVIRFTIETPSFPLFVPLALVGQADVNKTVYSITLRYNNTSYTRPVIWIPQDNTVVKPSGPVRQTDVSPASPYYYCYSYQHFADCINNSFKSASDAINIDIGANVFTPPYLQYDALTNLFTLGGNVNFYRTASDGGVIGPVSIFFNAELYNLFASLPYIYTAGKYGLQLDYQLLLTTGTNVPTASPQPYITNIRKNNLYPLIVNDVISVQEYQTLSLWCPVKSLIFKTNLLSTAPEIMATPAVYEDGDFNINGAKQNADILNVMIDYVPQLDKGTEYKPYIFYQPNGEYKLTDLYGKTPVDAIDISVFWKDCFGNLIPFTLSASSSATIKILFRKKRFNSTKV